LFPNGGTSIERADDGAHRARRANRRQARDARADDQELARRNLAGVDAAGPVEDVTERAINALRRFGD
jgi:hypothetical protein